MPRLHKNIFHGNLHYYIFDFTRHETQTNKGKHNCVLPPFVRAMTERSCPLMVNKGNLLNTTFSVNTFTKMSVFI
jgi:outer membrane protein assembly factor BamE (lipoprotein component of BamABCDE complex)